MTDDRNNPDQSLAAEFALGVLAGDDLRRAQELVRTDPAFRLEVARWAGRLAPMLDEIEPVVPPGGAWGSSSAWPTGAPPRMISPARMQQRASRAMRTPS